MSLPSQVSSDKTERVRSLSQAAGEDPGQSTSNGSRPDPQRAPLRIVRRAVQAVLGRRLSARVKTYLIEPARFAEEGRRRLGELEDDLGSLRSRLRHRSEQVDAMTFELHSATVNLELLKGEVRSVVEALEDLGMAIAPATGLVGAEARLSELRERVNGLDRRLRSIISAPASVREHNGGAHESGTRAAKSALFDYVGFERRFRGDPAVIAERLAERYLDRLAAHPPVVDLGCGNGVLVAMLKERQVEAVGIDTDPSMVAEARVEGLDVRLVDAAAFLRAQPPASIGAIIATHVVEHLDLAELVELLELAANRIMPGGLFIAETPNPASLIVLGNSYILDPTHVRPLHPSLFTFLCEGAGFRDVRLEFYEPAGDYQLQLIDGEDAPRWARQVNEAFTKLNRVLFGPQEYAIVATAAPAVGDDAELA